jgi:hypothetical protein
MNDHLRLVARVVFVLLLEGGLAFGAAILGVPTVYYGGCTISAGVLDRIAPSAGGSTSSSTQRSAPACAWSSSTCLAIEVDISLDGRGRQVLTREVSRDTLSTPWFLRR